MTPFEFARDLLAVGGAAALIFVAAKKLSKRGGDDAPIRVKGGSVTITNKDDQWEEDHEEGREYHYKSFVKRLRVRAWDSEEAFDNHEQPRFKIECRRAELIVRRSTAANDFYVVTFRANGSMRVRSSSGELAPLGNTLKDSDANHWPETIVVYDGGVEIDRYSFAGKTGFAVFKPLK